MLAARFSPGSWLHDEVHDTVKHLEAGFLSDSSQVLRAFGPQVEKPEAGNRDWVV